MAGRCAWGRRSISALREGREGCCGPLRETAAGEPPRVTEMAPPSLVLTLGYLCGGGGWKGSHEPVSLRKHPPKASTLERLTRRLGEARRKTKEGGTVRALTARGAPGVRSGPRARTRSGPRARTSARVLNAVPKWRKPVFTSGGCPRRARTLLAKPGVARHLDDEPSAAASAVRRGAWGCPFGAHLAEPSRRCDRF